MCQIVSNIKAKIGRKDKKAVLGKDLAPPFGHILRLQFSFNR